MKQLKITLFACLALMPFTQAFALTSPLNQSIFVTEEILGSSKLQNTIPQNESIVAIRRVSPVSDETNVTVEINTHAPAGSHHQHHHDCHHDCHHQDLHTYRVEVRLTAPDGPGRVSVEVLSVKRVSSHLHFVFENVEALN